MINPRFLKTVVYSALDKCLFYSVRTDRNEVPLILFFRYFIIMIITSF